MSVDFTARWGQDLSQWSESLNVGQVNATVLLDLLGYLPPAALEDELADAGREMRGEAGPEDFKARITLARAMLDVATDDTHGRQPVHDGNWYYGGRAPGRLAELLGELEALADLARSQRGNGGRERERHGEEEAREHGSRIIAALERAWAAIRARHPEVPNVVIVTGAGSNQKGTPEGYRLRGHHWPERWVTDPAERRMPELFVAGELLAAAAAP